MSRLGIVNNFLGIGIKRSIDNSVITLDQSQAIKNLAKRFNVDESRTFKTLIEKKLNLDKNVNEHFKTKLPYKELLGTLMYIMMGNRPDICFCISYFEQFQDCATDQHLKHLLKVLKYLMCTADLKLIFKHSNDNLVGYFDADWANNSIDRKSVTGFCFKFFDNK